jgi:hypothetical protein
LSTTSAAAARTASSPSCSTSRWATSFPWAQRGRRHAGHGVRTAPVDPVGGHQPIDDLGVVAGSDARRPHPADHAGTVAPLVASPQHRGMVAAVRGGGLPADAHVSARHQTPSRDLATNAGLTRRLDRPRPRGAFARCWCTLPRPILVRGPCSRGSDRRFGRRSWDGGQQREAIIASLDMWPDRVRQHLAAGRNMIGGHAGRERDGVERARMATPGSTASPSNSRIALAHEGSEAVTRCATVLTRPASSVRLLDYPVLIASGRFSDHERWPPRAGGCRGADRDRREGGRVARPHPRLPTPRRKTRPQTPPDMTR